MNTNYCLQEQAFSLCAANGKPTAIYDKRYVYLSVCLRKRIYWIFVVANSSTPIIVIHLLKHYNLLIDSSRRRLIDRNTKLSTRATSFIDCRLCPATAKHIIGSYLQWILYKYPELCKTRPKLPCVTSNAAHHITTTESSIFLTSSRKAKIGQKRVRANDRLEN